MKKQAMQSLSHPNKTFIHYIIYYRQRSQSMCKTIQNTHVTQLQQTIMANQNKKDFIKSNGDKQNNIQEVITRFKQTMYHLLLSNVLDKPIMMDSLCKCKSVPV